MPGLESSLTKEMGGLPAWGWGVGVSGLIIGYAVYKNHKANADNAAKTDGTVDPQANTGNEIDPATGLPYSEEAPDSGFPYAPINSYLGQDPTNSAYPVGLPPQGLPGPVTNQQWARIAADYIIGKGNDPTLTESALSDYINGKSITAAQKAIVDMALQFFGSPPEGVVSTPPPPTGGGTSTNVAVDHFYKVTKKTSWSSVAKSQGVFGGNGAALFYYNLLPQKHQPQTYPGLIKAYPYVNKGEEVAIPKKGYKISLGGGVGPVTT